MLGPGNDLEVTTLLDIKDHAMHVRFDVTITVTAFLVPLLVRGPLSIPGNQLHDNYYIQGLFGNKCSHFICCDYINMYIAPYIKGFIYFG